MFETKAPRQRALVIHPTKSEASTSRVPEMRLEEACGLALALDLEVLHSSVENIREIRPSTLFGKGKIELFQNWVEQFEIDVVIIDDAITPVQQRNLEKQLNVKIIDRTGLILEIFSLRARTKEGKLQVELARLSYEKSRLVKTWTHLERQRGGTGKTGGPGERQIEIDRRLINNNIDRLKREIEEVRRTRSLQRGGREKVPFPIVALVGYTNAGKSTLFNNVTKANVLAKDMLFATLDTVSRAFRIPGGSEIILSDTVGFITDLPHELIAAFRATLEEVADADILLHVRDISSPESEAQKHDVDIIIEKILSEKELVPAIIEVWNKADLLKSDEYEAAEIAADKYFRQYGTKCVLVSSLTGEGLQQLYAEIEKELKIDTKSGCIELLPIHGKIRAWLYERGAVKNEKILDNGNQVLEIALNRNQHSQLLAKFGTIKEVSSVSFT